MFPTYLPTCLPTVDFFLLAHTAEKLTRIDLKYGARREAGCTASRRSKLLKKTALHRQISHPEPKPMPKTATTPAYLPARPRRPGPRCGSLPFHRKNWGRPPAIMSLAWLGLDR
ncbi:hypothetical protein ONS95_007693 [Cadophora gregata]|uniref:uncharacterized protein n=1 Tax=Cadophora gregata TaxID=51156 RepID=UPI0026DC3335|nr:uncharacterized protein ONS95_007693 [Cadophora gregata]KAK0126073.1 hypothetical protein ONS95_007693 [Cadophora gregata]